jgi:hypothetical protein
MILATESPSVNITCCTLINGNGIMTCQCGTVSHNTAVFDWPSGVVRIVY